MNLADALVAMDVVTDMIPLTVDEEDTEERRKTLEQKLEELEKRMMDRQNNDSLVFARIREELDFLANAKKEVVDSEKQKEADAINKIKAIEMQLNILNGSN